MVVTALCLIVFICTTSPMLLRELNDGESTLEAEILADMIDNLKASEGQPDTVNTGLKKEGRESDYNEKMILADVIADLEASDGQMGNFAGSLGLNGKERDKREQICSDKRPDCNGISNYCDEQTYSAVMEESCAKTCKFCVDESQYCKDSLPTVSCLALSRQRYCETAMTSMRKHCNKTCRFCASPTGPACENTPYGCCWDQKTVKQDIFGSQCPGIMIPSFHKSRLTIRACADSHAGMCKRFLEDCQSNKNIRHLCPKTCGLCTDSGTQMICRDNPEQRRFCSSWRLQGMCSSQEASMRTVCPRTCGFCKSPIRK